MNTKLSAPFIAALGLLLITLAVNVSMPLFRVYTAAANLNNGQTSLVLAAYVVGMIPCYVFLGGLSDRVGRKPVLIASVLVSFLATVIITISPTATALVFARFFQGIGVGIGMGAGTAYISELLPGNNTSTRAAGLASLSTAIGFGGGALATSISLLINFTTSPITYVVLLVITVLGLMLIFWLPNIPPIGGKLIRLPYFPHGSLPVNVAIGICWAATGVVIAIIPTQLAKFELGAHSGFCLTLINWSGALVQPWIRSWDPLRSVRVGVFLVPLGFALVIVGCYAGFLPVLFLGTSIIGLSAYGYSYLGGLALIAMLGGQQKARAVSGYMFFGYLGFGIPAIFLGYLSDHFGIVNALMVFEAVIIALSMWLSIRFCRTKTNVA
ncbi:MAG: MFS transporter [Chryseolinea sp.]